MHNIRKAWLDKSRIQENYNVIVIYFFNSRIRDSNKCRKLILI